MAKLAAGATALDGKLATLAGASPIPGGKATLATVNGTLAALLNAVESADAAPTSQSYTLFGETQQSLQALLASWQSIQQQDVAEFNRLARRSGVSEIKLPAAQ
jgi:membrane protein required for beta-lactamase induction